MTGKEVSKVDVIIEGYGSDRRGDGRPSDKADELWPEISATD